MGSLHRVCAYVQYRQMFNICIVMSYADGKDMRMSDLCRCRAYGYALHIYSSLFSRSDPKKGSSGSSSPTLPPGGHETQDVLCLQLDFLLYVVFIPFPVTGRSAPEKGSVVIPCA